MKFICAPDSFKESLTAQQAADAMAAGIRDAASKLGVAVEVDRCPIADGGEGTVQAMVAATGGEVRTTQVLGPLCDPVESAWGLMGDSGAMDGTSSDSAPKTAIIEMAEASGLALVREDQRDPRLTTTFGTGQLIREAIIAGAKRIILGIGGSATNDAGCGMAAALGALFFDQKGQLILKAPSGGMLSTISQIETAPMQQLTEHVEFIAACDVDNPLTGVNGASRVYGPQKGATPEMIDELDQNLAHFAELVRRDLGCDIEHMAGAGAAGGLGGGLAAFLNARLEAGAPLVLDAVGFTRRVADCDHCFTGEGKIDGQTLSGKAILAVTQAAARHDVKTTALVGCVGDDADRCLDAGLNAYHCIGEGLPAEESMRRAAELLRTTAERIATTKLSS